MNLTVQQLNRALMHARWDGPFDPQKAVDELNSALAEKPERPAGTVWREKAIELIARIEKFAKQRDAERCIEIAQDLRGVAILAREYLLTTPAPDERPQLSAEKVREPKSIFNCTLCGERAIFGEHKCAPAAPPVLQAEPSDNERIPQDSDERVLLYIYGANNLAERKAIMAAIRREAEQEARLDEAKWWYDAWDGEQIFKATERLAGMKSALADSPVSGKKD